MESRREPDPGGRASGRLSGAKCFAPAANGKPYSTGDATAPDGGTIIEAETIHPGIRGGGQPAADGHAAGEGKNGRVVVEATMRSKERPEVWALGDCAAIPDPTERRTRRWRSGCPREARVLGIILRR